MTCLEDQGIRKGVHDFGKLKEIEDSVRELAEAGKAHDCRLWAL